MGTTRRILIIGCSDGIGLALAKRLLAGGWRVTGLSRRASPIEHPEYFHVVGDVAEAGFRRRVEELEIERGPFSDCVYCAGIGLGFDASNLDGDVTVFKVNLLAAIEAAAALVPRMVERRQGHFVVLSSMADKLLIPDSPAYAASKAGLSSYFESLGLAVRSSGVSVTNIRFGFVDTKMARSPVKPFLRQVDWAVSVVVRALGRRAIRISRPRRMAVLVSVLRWLTDWRLRLFTR